MFGVYMPDSSYPDQDVEVVYEQLGERLRSCSFKSWRCLVAGDFNAEVGQQEDSDDLGILGPGGLPVRNARGDMFLQWCTTHRLALGNTRFEAQLDQTWTWRNGSLRKQLDYILPDLQLFRSLMWCGVCTDLDTGSDHRAVRACFAYFSTDNAQFSEIDRKRKKTRFDKKWRVDVQKYQEELNSNLARH